MSDQDKQGELSQIWVHSHEEDSGDTLVFRPSSYNFPPSRGRKVLNLRPGGTASVAGIGADDRPTNADRSWSVSGDSLHVGGSTYSIVSLAADKLVVRRSP